MTDLWRIFDTEHAPIEMLIELLSLIHGTPKYIGTHGLEKAYTDAIEILVSSERK